MTAGLDLPAPPITRWTPQRKAALLLAVATDQLTIEEACQRYELGPEEIAAWSSAFQRFGTAGLRMTRLQMLREQHHHWRRRIPRRPA